MAIYHNIYQLTLIHTEGTMQELPQEIIEIIREHLLPSFNTMLSLTCKGMMKSSGQYPLAVRACDAISSEEMLRYAKPSYVPLPASFVHLAIESGDIWTLRRYSEGTRFYLDHLICAANFDYLPIYKYVRERIGYVSDADWWTVIRAAGPNVFQSLLGQMGTDGRFVVHERYLPYTENPSVALPDDDALVTAPDDPPFTDLASIKRYCTEVYTGKLSPHVCAVAKRRKHFYTLEWLRREDKCSCDGRYHHTDM